MKEQLIHLTNGKTATLIYPTDITVEDVGIIKEAIRLNDLGARTFFITLRRENKTVTISGTNDSELTEKWQKLYPDWNCINRT